MAAATDNVTLEGAEHSRPRWRGTSHQLGFFAAVPLGVALPFAAESTTGRVAAIVYATSVAFMFGASAIYHRVNWSSRTSRLRMRRVDHAGIFALIAGTYTPVGLLVLHGSLRVVVLGIVWAGAAAAILLKVFWVGAPKWLAAAIAVALGWVAVVVLPQVESRVGLTGLLLLLGGGVAYTVGALVYVFRRPDPAPASFGYHELFHALVVIAVGLQYASIAFCVLPSR